MPCPSDFVVVEKPVSLEIQENVTVAVRDVELIEDESNLFLEEGAGIMLLTSDDAEFADELLAKNDYPECLGGAGGTNVPQGIL